MFGEGASFAKEIGQLFEDILENLLQDICKEDIVISDGPLSQLISHQYSEKCHVYQGKCYQQYSQNLCGYHAVYNSLCFLHTIKKGKTSYNILSGASFWIFKRRMERFLIGVKQQGGYENEWPWRVEDILYGDFQRSYNEICQFLFEDFDIFRDFEHFEFFSFTWQFQYQNLLLPDQEKRVELESCITYFKDYIGQKPLILSFMLGITDHWMCFFAVKLKNEPQYWFFDSSNLKFLELNAEEIEKYVQELDQERIQLKKEGFKPFDKKNMGVCMRDTQISLKLIVDCLEGRTTLQSYAYNQQFNVFAKKLQLCKEDEQEKIDKTIAEYWYNINSFFESSSQWSLFTKQNQLRLEKLIKVTESLQTKSHQCKQFYELSVNFSAKSYGN